MKTQFSQSRHKLPFTLVEIMVALAVLLLMMYFLLTFVNSSRRIFTETNRQNILFNDAQAVMTILENDLNNMVCSYEIGKTMPFFFEDESTQEKWLFFYSAQPNLTGGTAEESNAGLYPVIYHFDGDHTLYRRLWDKTEGLHTPWDILTLKQPSFSEIKKMLPSVDSLDYEVLNNIDNFIVTPMKFDHKDGKFTETSNKIPSIIKVTFDLYSRDSISEKRWSQLTGEVEKNEIDLTRRRFTKSFFLPQKSEDVIVD